MKTIIAATDFTDAASVAVDYASNIAIVTDCNLLLLHVSPFPISYGEIADRYIDAGDEVQKAEINIEKEKERVAAQTRGSVKISTLVLQGTLPEGIQQACAGHNVYAVVMGQSSQNSIERFLFGSHAAAATQQLPWPIMVIPPNVRFTGIRNLGVACDFNQVIDTIPVSEIRAIVKKFNATLHILNVRNSVRPTAFSPEVIQESAWLQDLLSDLQPVYHFVEGDDADKLIIDFADKQQLDLLMVIPKNHHWLSRLFRQRHSKNIVLHAHVPVLSVHQQD